MAAKEQRPLDFVDDEQGDENGGMEIDSEPLSGPMEGPQLRLDGLFDPENENEGDGAAIGGVEEGPSFMDASTTHALLSGQPSAADVTADVEVLPPLGATFPPLGYVVPGGGRKRSKRDELGKPKMPFTGYVRFLLEHREKVASDNPHLLVPDVTKIVAAKWREARPEEKAPYIEAAERDKQVYLEEMRVYNERQFRENMGQKDGRRAAAKAAVAKFEELGSGGSYPAHLFGGETSSPLPRGHGEDGDETGEEMVEARPKVRRGPGRPRGSGRGAAARTPHSALSRAHTADSPAMPTGRPISAPQQQHPSTYRSLPGASAAATTANPYKSFSSQAQLHQQQLAPFPASHPFSQPPHASTPIVSFPVVTAADPVIAGDAHLDVHEMYCKACKQYFDSLANMKEHVALPTHREYAGLAGGDGSASANGTTVGHVNGSVENSNGMPPRSMPKSVFSVEFLEHNRKREEDMRELRRAALQLERDNRELEDTNAQLKDSLDKLILEASAVANENGLLRVSLMSLQDLVVVTFGSLALPGVEAPTHANIVDYLAKLAEQVTASSMDAAFVRKMEGLLGRLMEHMAQMQPTA